MYHNMTGTGVFRIAFAGFSDGNELSYFVGLVESLGVTKSCIAVGDVSASTVFLEQYSNLNRLSVLIAGIFGWDYSLGC